MSSDERRAMAAAQIDKDTRSLVTLIERHGVEDFNALCKVAIEVHRQKRPSVDESSSLERTS